MKLKKKKVHLHINFVSENNLFEKQKSKSSSLPFETSVLRDTILIRLDRRISDSLLSLIIDESSLPLKQKQNYAFISSFGFGLMFN